MNILRYKATAKKLDVAPITIRRWATHPEYAHMGFPKPISLGENSEGFVEQELDDYLAKQAAQRDNAA